MDSDTNDIATGLSACVTKDGQSGALTANLQMGSHKITGLSAGSASGDAVNFAQVFSGGTGYTNISINGVTITGVADASAATSLLVPLVPTLAGQAASKGYADGLAFSSALPAIAGQPVGYVVEVTAASTAGYRPGAGIPRSARTSNTILAATDRGSLLDYTSGTFSQTLTAAATLGSLWYAWARNTGTGVVTFDPNGTETIGGATTVLLNPGDIWLIECDGVNFQLKRLFGLNKQIYTSGSGNFTVPGGVYRVYVECWGAGGGCPNAVVGAGGGGGGYSAGWLNTTPGATLAYVVGAGASNAAGGNTTFAATLTANGGAIGANNTTATGGSASGGDINIAGSPGASNATFALGGASSCGAPAMPTVTTTTMTGLAPGGGGSMLNSGGTAIGGNGEIRIRWA